MDSTEQFERLSPVFYQPEAPHENDAREAVAGAPTPKSAWESLLVRGLLPDAWQEPAVRFLQPRHAGHGALRSIAEPDFSPPGVARVAVECPSGLAAYELHGKLLDISWYEETTNPRWNISRVGASPGELLAVRGAILIGGALLDPWRRPERLRQLRAYITKTRTSESAVLPFEFVGGRVLPIPWELLPISYPERAADAAAFAARAKAVCTAEAIARELQVQCEWRDKPVLWAVQKPLDLRLQVEAQKNERDKRASFRASEGQTLFRAPHPGVRSPVDFELLRSDGYTLQQIASLQSALFLGKKGAEDFVWAVECSKQSVDLRVLRGVLDILALGVGIWDFDPGRIVLSVPPLEGCEEPHDEELPRPEPSDLLPGR